jgi:hypothetical protein
MFNNEFIDTTKRKIKNTVSIVKNAVPFSISKIGEPQISLDTHQQRLNTCRSCEHYNTLDHTCNECGCDINMKISLLAESCPLKKWLPVATQNNGGCGGCGK